MTARSFARSLGLGLAAALAAAGGVAAAEPISAGAPGRRIVVPTAVEQFAPRPAEPISPTIYLERCTGSCMVTGGGINDASVLASTIPRTGLHRIGEFTSADGEVGAAADAEWAMLVDCMKKVFSPYAVAVTDVRPSAGTFHVAIVAGHPANIGFGSDVLGVAPLASNCSPQDNVMSFSFASVHTQTDPVDRTSNLCWTAAQESAHAFGLDHQFQYVDGGSACNDPMTYRIDCGGIKYFRNRRASCGEDEPRPCRCSETQNSHRKLIEVFGPGTPLTAPPTVAITTPAGDGGPLGAAVVGSAFSERGVDKVALVLNGYAWVVARGAAFGDDGQPPSDYSLVVPLDQVPDGNYDIVLRALDDIGGATESQLRTAIKGAPCTSADSCLEFQRCEAGKCLWDPPAGELGDDCSYKQFCTSDLCGGPGDRAICTQACSADDVCPAGFDCVGGLCGFADGGCCSVSNASPLRVAGRGGLAAVLLGLIVRRRRSRRS